VPILPDGQECPSYRTGRSAHPTGTRFDTLLAHENVQHRGCAPWMELGVLGD
jgi:hypothetical protein